jgi:hypothetical protein
VADIQIITCATFDAKLEAEQRPFVLGVANGLGITAGLFKAYAGTGQDMAGSPPERDAITTSYQAIRELMVPRRPVAGDEGRVAGGRDGVAWHPGTAGELGVGS